MPDLSPIGVRLLDQAPVPSRRSISGGRVLR
jgi:hypothetical protein